MTSTPTTVTNGALVDQIRAAITDARAHGQPTPGRPTLVALTGATDHAVRKVLGELAAGDPPTSTASAAASTDASGSPATRHTPVTPAPLATPAGTTPTPAAAPGEPGGPGQPVVSTGEPTPPAAPHDTTTAASAGGSATDPGDSVPATTVSAGGRFTARIGFVFGSVTSVAANVLAARIPPAHAGPYWSPNIAAEIGAAVWPLILLLSVEILARVSWPNVWHWALAKFGGAGTVALGSAVISYGHIRAVLASWNYNSTGADVGPLVVDGLMVISGFALLAMSHHHTPPALAIDPTQERDATP